MSLYRTFTDDQRLRDLRIGFASRDQTQHIELTLRKFREGVDFIFANALQFLNDARGNPRIQNRFTLRGFADGSGKFIGFHIFQEIRDRARAHSREDIFILMM